MVRAINAKGRALIIEREGLFLKPYPCSAKIPTIGIGTTAYPNGKKVTLKDSPITERQAYEYLDYELKEKAEILEIFCLKKGVLLNDNQFSALLSFAYNLGCGPIIDPGRSMHQALLSGSNKQIREAFMMYTKVKKKFLGVVVMKEEKGLVIRRKREADLYFS